MRVGKTRVRVFLDDRQTNKTWVEREIGLRKPIKKRKKN